MDFQFNEEKHLYTVDGSKVVSVTEAMRSWVKVRFGNYVYYVSTIDGTVLPAKVFEGAQDQGRAVHKALPMLVAGKLNWTILHPDLVNPLKQFEKWLDDYNVKILDMEIPEYSKKYEYAGKRDILCYLLNNQRTLVDVKTASIGLIEAQTAAYEALYRENSRYRSRLDRASLILPKDGAYKFEIFTSRYDHDFAYFKTKLYENKYLTALKKLKPKEEVVWNP